MASSKEYLTFILEQLSDLEGISYRAMMGEYIIYYREKIVGGIYDDRLLVKPVKSAVSLMPNAIYELPYDGAKLMMNEEGSAQGNIISPILANIYMHNVLTLWYKFIITKECKGDNFLIVYADDFVAGFQYKWEAENYYKLLKERMEKFGLQLEESKSRLLQSGAYIARAKQKSGESTRLEVI